MASKKSNSVRSTARILGGILFVLGLFYALYTVLAVVLMKENLARLDMIQDFTILLFSAILFLISGLGLAKEKFWGTYGLVGLIAVSLLGFFFAMSNNSSPNILSSILFFVYIGFTIFFFINKNKFT